MPVEPAAAPGTPCPSLSGVLRRPRHLVLVAALAATAAVGACTASEETATPATTAAPVSQPTPAPAEFCAALEDMTTGDAASLAEVEEVLIRLEATAPPEIAPEVATFVALARESATAFAPLGPEAPQAEVLAVLEGLSPEARGFVEQIGATASTGELPEGPVGDVIGYGALACGPG